MEKQLFLLKVIYSYLSIIGEINNLDDALDLLDNKKKICYNFGFDDQRYLI